MGTKAKIYSVIKVINASISENKRIIKEMFDPDNNMDFNLREFKIGFKNETADGFLIYYDGMTNQNYLNRDIMRSLLTCDKFDASERGRRAVVTERIISVAPLSIVNDYDEVGQKVSFGDCAVFIDGCACCFSADVKGWDNRGVDAPTQEVSLAGPQEAFSESIMTNIALVRKILRSPNTTAVNIPVGNSNNVPCAVMYLRDIANPDIVAEVTRRLKGIDTEYIFSSSDVEMMIEDSTYFPMTRTLKTERPDRVAAMLADGKVAVVVQGSPFALILPTTTMDLIEATEDNYVRVPEANLMRLVRLFGMAVSVLLSALFIAVMLYHQEVLPTDLLIAISATREKVPFPLILELLLMELSFELIKEASVRVPNPIGSTLGIIGGLILGQAAVEASVVSPLLIIIVSLGGIGSFSTPTLSLSRSLSVLKFIYIFAAYFFGLPGLTAAVIATLSLLASTTTFGVPFLSRYRAGGHSSESVLVKPIWKKEKRPPELMPQDEIKQPEISRKWKYDKNNEPRDKD